MKIDKYFHLYGRKDDVVFEEIPAPSAQPELRYDEWCTDCKEYDHERHCCPRWNRVIRTTLQEVQGERKKGKWIDKLYGDYRCSVCGSVIELGDEIVMSIKRFNYCPDCGADMKI